MNNMIDLSHEIEDGLITYPGTPSPVISDYLSREKSKATYAEGVTFQIGRIEMIANTGTYVDAPFSPIFRCRRSRTSTIAITGESSWSYDPLY
jgi:kynurenine formamidase